MGWNPITSSSSIVRVATAGTPQQVIAVHKACQAVLIQALPNNTGRVVIGQTNAVRANAAGVDPSGPVLAILGAPTANTATPPSANGGNPSAPAAIDLQNFWIDASVSGEGVLVSFIA